MPELMKGKVWHERKHKMTYPCRVEIKHDEIRCHIIVHDDGSVEFLSYAGKPLANMQGFANVWQGITHVTGYKEFDCGFEVHGNFNDSYRWVRSTNGLPADLQDKKCVFYLFDLPELREPYAQRLPEFDFVANAARYVRVCVPDALEAYNEEDVEACFEHVRSRGFEGVMVKSLEHTYQRGKRIDGWLKMKPEEDADAKITGFVQARATVDDPSRGVRVGDLLDRIAAVQVECEDGSTATPHGIPHDLGRDMLKHPDKYLGEWVQFKYMQRDRQGGYRHPTFVRFREAKA